MIVIEPIRNGQYIMDGAYALAVQVYVQDQLEITEPVLLPYIVGPTVQVGRFQNSLVEVNEDYVEDHGILLVRRDTEAGPLPRRRPRQLLLSLPREHRYLRQLRQDVPAND